MGIETRLIFSFQPLGFNFGKCEDAHRIEKRKDDLERNVDDQEPLLNITPTKKRKRQKVEELDLEDLGLPTVKEKGIPN